jgi:phosphohistidine phosphatase
VEVALDIYLIRHAESLSEKEDPERPLSEEGKVTMEKVGSLAARLGINPDMIYHSGKLRAKQTAEILAQHLRLSDKVRERPGLAPLDQVRTTADWLQKEAASGTRSLAIVGHLPFLDKLASLLVAGNEDIGVVAFQHGAIVQLVPAGRKYAVHSVISKQLA